jgi:hypothetical protein
MSELFDAFREAYLFANARFNEHDFEAAFAGLSETVEWHPMTSWVSLGAEVLHGRDAIVAGFKELLGELPDWHVEPEEFLEVSGRVFIVRCLAIASGQASGAPASQGFTQVWELAEDATVIRVREYEDHEEALAAAHAAP